MIDESNKGKKKVHQLCSVKLLRSLQGMPEEYIYSDNIEGTKIWMFKSYDY